MKPGALLSGVAVLVSLCLLPWRGGEGGAFSSCQAMTLLPKLEILSEVKAERKHVSLLDLCDAGSLPEDWKNSMAGVDIGEAPAPGAEKIIQPRQLQAYLQRFFASQGYDASRTDIVMPQNIVIKRPSIQVSREQLEAIYRGFVETKAPWDAQDMAIRAVYASGPVDLPVGNMTYEVSASPRERYVGNVVLTIQFLIDGQKDRAVRVTGKVDLFQNIVHSVHPLKRNDVISEKDIEFQRINISDAMDRFAIQYDQVVGKRVLKDVGFHQPILLADLDNPLVIRRNSVVTIVYRQPGLELSARGQAREDAGVGDTVRIVNVTTNRTIPCRVIDATTVQAVP